MTETPDSSGFAALLDLEARCRANAVGLPHEKETPDVWAGVLFLVGNDSLLASLDDIGEVLDLPGDVTHVPATKTWVRGLANNRGTLLPVFDLQAYLFGMATPRSPKNRVLVVRQDEFPFGLLVTDVVGIRHFDAAARRDTITGLPEALQPFVVGGFGVEPEAYPVFSLRTLGEDAQFGLVAA